MTVAALTAAAARVSARFAPSPVRGTFLAVCLAYDPGWTLTPEASAIVAGLGMVQGHWSGGGLFCDPADWQTPIADREPAEDVCRAYARQCDAQGRTVVQIDEEEWGPGPWGADPARFASYDRRLTNVIRWMRAERPGLRLGVYGTPPGAYPALGESPEDAAARASTDAMLMAAEHVRHVDYVCPSWYGEDDADFWERDSANRLDQLRQYRRPVMPEISPSLQGLYNDRPLVSPATLGRQVAFCRQHCDGLFLWGDGQVWRSPAHVDAIRAALIA